MSHDRVWSRLRPVAGGVLMLTALLATCFAWAFSSPLGSSPDDDYHQSSIWCPPPIEDSNCRLHLDGEGNVIGAYVPELVRHAPCYAFHPDSSAACVEDLRSDVLVPSTGRIDRGGYPGPYYRFMHIFVGEDVTRSVLAARFFNASVAVILIGAAALIMPPAGRRMMVLSNLGTFIPLGVFVVASINPSSWAITGLAVTWLSMYSLVTGTTRWKVVASAVLLLVGAALAGASRSDAGAFVVVAVLGFGVALWPHTWEHRRRLMAPALAILIGTASYLSGSQADVLVQGFGEDYARDPGDVLFHNITELPALFAGVYGLRWPLGWLDTDMPAMTYIGGIVILGAALVRGLRELWLAKVLALVVVGGSLVVLPLTILQGSLNLVGDSVQPRYLLPLLTAFLGVALLGRRTCPPGFRLGQTTALYVVLVAANSAALHANIRRYVTGQDILSLNLGQTAEWWWSFGPSPMEVWAVGSAAFAVTALSLFVVRERQPGAPTDSAIGSRGDRGTRL